MFKKEKLKLFIIPRRKKKNHKKEKNKEVQLAEQLSFYKLVR